MKIKSCFSDSFKTYKSFPPHSQYKAPSNVKPDAKWASMHIQGKQCFGGHLEDNVFHIVFLDEDHKFWPCEKKHT